MNLLPGYGSVEGNVCCGAFPCQCGDRTEEWRNHHANDLFTPDGKSFAAGEATYMAGSLAHWRHWNDYSAVESWWNWNDGTEIE